MIVLNLNYSDVSSTRINLCRSQKTFRNTIICLYVQNFVAKKCFKHMDESVGTANGNRLGGHQQKLMLKSQHKFRYSWKM